MVRCIPVGLYLVVLFVSANVAALSGQGDSPVGTLDTVLPEFSNLVVIPPEAVSGESVTLTFTASKPLIEDPVVQINGSDAAYISDTGGLTFIYEYTVAIDDTLGMATVALAGSDSLGNAGAFSSNTVLSIVQAEPQMPLHSGLVILAVVFLAAFFLLRKRVRVFLVTLFVLLLVAAPMALAQNPVVSNISFVQGPDGMGGTQVDVYYDLDAPNGPCDITLALSKDGGMDGFTYPVMAITGDVAGVLTGTGYHLVWAVADDYPNELIPNAQLRVIADDGLSLFTLTYTADVHGTLSGSTTQTVVEGTDGTSVTAVPDYGYHFVQWSDGSTDNPRTDMGVLSDITVEATFAINVYTLSYTAGADGSVTGDTPQQITHGEDGTAVEAVPDADCYFLQWSDGRTDNPRADTAVVRNQQIMAIFRSNTKTILLPGDVPLVLRRIPPGTFTMGSETTEQGHNATEGPTHDVTFGYEYFVGKYPVTQQQWLALMGTWPGTAPDAANGLGNNYPAYHISWADAQAFVAALNAHITATGQGDDSFRLPSEAEWEYACRAGTQTRFYFGDSLGVDDLCEDDGARGQNMWYCGNNTIPGTKAVGQQLPNAYDLCDTHGNVREWCEDDWHNTYDNAPVDGAAWNDPIRSTSRVVRGGHWDDNAADCRAAARDSETPDYGDATSGFRLCFGYPVGSGEHIGVWHNALFAGAGQPDGLIKGNASVKGSACLLGDNLNEGVNAVFCLDMSGTTFIHNNYDGIDSIFIGRIPPLPTVQYDATTVATLNGILRVRRGLVSLNGNAMVGEPWDGSPVKRTMDAVYVTDGWTGNLGVNNVYSDNGTEQPYDLGSRLNFPLLSDDWRNPDGARVYNFSTGTWYTHEEYFTEVLVGDPDISDDGIYEGDMTINRYLNPGFYFNATTGEKVTGSDTLSVTPAPEHSYILTRKDSGVIFVNGQIKINGNLIITGAGGSYTFYYSGRASILVTGNVTLNTNLLTINNGDTGNFMDSFPNNNCLAIMSKGNTSFGTSIQCEIMGAFYAEQSITVSRTILLVGSCVARDFNMGNQVPSFSQVLSLADNLPLGMIANYPM